jgi:hypothetical protein
MQSTNIYKTSEEIETEIRNIFNENKVSDLKKFINKRACLNTTNQILIYLFHIIQSAGVLTTTIAAGYNMKELIWIGVGMNILASLINVFEKTNDTMSKRILKDIQAIKTGTYVDEGTIIDVDTKVPDNKSVNGNSNVNHPPASDNGDVESNNGDSKQTVKSLLKTPLISDGYKVPNVKTESKITTLPSSNI